MRRWSMRRPDGVGRLTVDHGGGLTVDHGGGMIHGGGAFPCMLKKDFDKQTARPTVKGWTHPKHPSARPMPCAFSLTICAP